jgi:hypothetical protein
MPVRYISNVYEWIMEKLRMEAAAKESSCQTLAGPLIRE